MDPAARPREILTPARMTLAAAAVAVVVGGVAWSLRSVPFDSDEANHANIGLRQWQDLREFRFADFLRHSYRTGQFPFLHGWSLVPFFAAIGQSEFAARIAQVAWYLAGVLATGAAAGRLAGDDKRAGGFAAALFALSPLLSSHAGLCMLETPGAAATAVALLAFVEAARYEGPRRWRYDVFAAATVLAAYFVKHNYGIVLFPALLLGYAARLLFGDDRKRAAAGLLVFTGTVAAVIGAWYASPAQRAAFKGFLTNPAQTVALVEDAAAFRIPAFRTDNFTAYPSLVAVDYHVHWTVGAAVFALFLAGVWKLFRTRETAGVPAAAVLLGTWLMLSLGFREYALSRFIANALPGLWIVAALGAAPLLRKVPSTPAGQGATALLLAGAFGAHVLMLPARMRDDLENDGRWAPVFAAVLEKLPRPADVLVVNYTDAVSARTLEWRLATRPGASPGDHVVKGLIAERVYESDREFDAWMDDRRPWGRAGEPRESFVVEMNPGPTVRPVVPETVDRWRRALGRRGERLERVGQWTFPELDLAVTLWRDRAPPAYDPPGDVPPR
ncbi:MAG: hypothetical protein HMLKMBBP_01949 [Planctomycetes bacterium]|nr:hypothetical protein [Planctomycetota bacterium]